MSRLEDLNVNSLTRSMYYDSDEIFWLADNVDDFYHEQTIDQGSKERNLIIPGGDLKSFQENFNEKYLRDYSYHPSVYCCAGRGLHEAVKAHLKHPHFLHIDIKSFFPSVSVADVRQAFGRVGVDPDFIPTLTRLVTVNGELPQGAPTSVGVGNLALEEMDERLGNFCDGKGLTYTRYVDDISISGGSRLEKFESTIRNIVQECGWPLNDKGGLYGPEDRHDLLGLVAGEELSIREEYKTDLKELIHRYNNGNVDENNVNRESLLGKIEWVKGVNAEVGKELRELLN